MPMNPKPWVTLSCRNVHYFAMRRLPDQDIDFFDFEAVTLSPEARWPPGLPGEIATVDAVPSLLWLHGDGIATFDVVAAIVMVLTEG